MRAARSSLAGVLALATAPAGAQEVRTDLRLGANVEYESNVLRSNRLRGNYDGSDERFSPTLDVDVVRRIARNSVSLSGSAGYDLYRRNSYLNRARVALDGKAALRFGAFCGADLLAGIDFRQTDIAELGERVGNSSQEQHYSLSADCTRKSGLSPTVSGTYTTVNNSRASRERYDLRSYDVLAGITYTKLSLGTFELVVGRERIAHPHRWMGDHPDNDRTTVDQFGGGFRRGVSPRLAANIRLLWLRAHPHAAGVRSFSGIGWTSSLRWTPWPRFALEGTLDRGIRGQSSFASSYSISTSEDVTATYATGARSGVSLSVANTQRRFRGETLSPDNIPRGSDSTWVLGWKWHYDPARRLRILAGADYRHRDSRNDYFNYASFAATAGLRLRL